MTEPTPTTALTAAELDQAIVDASRQYIAVVRAYPRDTAKIAAAKAAVDELRAARAALG